MLKYKVDVIIPAWNEKHVILDLFKSINVLLKSNHECKIIIIAGGNDGTYGYVQNYTNSNPKLPIILLEQTHEGKNVALKKGINVGTNELILIVDADVTFEHNWLDKAIEKLDNLSVDLIRGISIPKKMTKYSISYYFYQLYFTLIKGGGFSHNAGVLFKRSVVEKIGLNSIFPDNVFIGIDTYMSNIMKKSGIKYVSTEDLHAYTNYPNSLEELISMSYRWTLSGITISNRNEAFKQFLKCTIVSVAPLGLLTIFSNTYMQMISFLSLFVIMAYINSIRSKFNNLQRKIDLSKNIGFSKSKVFMCVIFHSYLQEVCYSIAFIKVLFMKDLQNLRHFKGPR